ncbi:hypothetical protein [Alteromonas flava]|uniref:hypothetical protein n=1 Tax=Alteromonas flava TaxID=2048003 RepID=UPI000C285BA8|nr:hypothetical protein [Alteromonas flava]
MKVIIKFVGICATILGLVIGCAKESGINQTMEHALKQITSAKKLVTSTSTVEEAKVNKEELAQFGRAYASAMDEISKLDQTDRSESMEVTRWMPILAAELQQLMLEINSMQARSPEAAAIIIPELKNFQR